MPILMGIRLMAIDQELIMMDMEKCQMFVLRERLEMYGCIMDMTFLFSQTILKSMSIEVWLKEKKNHWVLIKRWKNLENCLAKNGWMLEVLVNCLHLKGIVYLWESE